MDLRTALIIASVMALLNGGVLGLMHRGLMIEVRGSAVDWRIGTLLFAAGGLVMAARDGAGEWPLSVAECAIFVGAALYWRANRRFCGLPDRVAPLLPVLGGVAGIVAFAWQSPQPALRVMTSAMAIAVSLLAAGWTLHASTRSDVVLSRRVLIGILAVVGVGVLLRGLLIGAGVFDRPSLTFAKSWSDLLIATMTAALAIVGTTAFLLMCLERSRVELQRTANTDHLTGLPNRRTISLAGDAKYASAGRGEHGLAVAVIDIDHFKRINDQHGHLIGDAALRHVASVLDECCPMPHLLGRQGGEEFVALLEAEDASTARAMAERLRRAVQDTPLEAPHLILPITASIGVGIMTVRDTCYDDLLRRADTALYAAKAQGRNRVAMGES